MKKLYVSPSKLRVLKVGTLRTLELADRSDIVGVLQVHRTSEYVVHASVIGLGELKGRVPRTDEIQSKQLRLVDFPIYACYLNLRTGSLKPDR